MNSCNRKGSKFVKKKNISALIFMCLFQTDDFCKGFQLNIAKEIYF